MENIQKQYPVMPLRNTVLFPQQVIPIYVGREKSLKLIEDLDPENKYLVVVAQQDGSIEDPKKEDINSFLEDKVAKWWLPDDIVFVDELPHTATGKLLKTDLRDEYKEYLLNKK